jgi:HEAT repeat protein
MGPRFLSRRRGCRRRHFNPFYKMLPMADAITKKLLQLLAPTQPADIRNAAVLVLGRLDGSDGEVARALCDCLDDPDSGVRTQAITAIGRRQIEAALPKLLDKVLAGGEESERAAHAIVRLGAKGTRALQGLMDRVAPGLRRRIAGALGGGETASAETAAVDALLDKDPGVVEAAARSLIAKIPALTPAHRRALGDHLLRLIKDKKNPLSAPSELAVVRLLAALDDERAVDVLWERTMPPCSPEMRGVALQVLGKWAGKAGKEQLQRLLACAADADFRVAAPALMILKTLPSPKQPTREWLALLEAPDVTVRNFAIEKLGERDSAQVADALMTQLDHPDQMLRDRALGCLAKMKYGRQNLARLLVENDDVQKTWLLAKALTSFVSDFPPSWFELLYSKGVQWLEAGDRRHEPLMYLFRATRLKDLSARLERRGLELRKKKKYAGAINYLRLLARDPACSPQLRLELACCGLKTGNRDLAPEARSADPTLAQFGRLLPAYESEVLSFLKSAKWLEPAELFYLGFHFADKDGPTRRFGGQVLKLLIQRSPRSKIAQDAKRKLRSAGLE